MSRSRATEWTRRYEHPHDPENRIPYYTAQIRLNLIARIYMDAFWSGDCRRPKCEGWILVIGNIWMHFKAEKGDRGGRKALAAAKRTASLCRLGVAETKGGAA